MSAFGGYIKARRMGVCKVSLREFCQENGFDIGNWSKLERGRRLPPDDRDTLEQYAVALKINKKSPDWAAFFDLADSARGQVPQDLLDDEAVADLLPAVFRTVRDSRMSEEKWEELKLALKKI